MSFVMKTSIGGFVTSPTISPLARVLLAQALNLFVEEKRN